MLIVSNEWTNGAIDEEIIMLVFYSQNGCILLAKNLFHDASKISDKHSKNPSGICCFMLNINSRLHRTVD